MPSNREELLTLTEGSPRLKELQNATNLSNRKLVRNSHDLSVFKLRKLSDELKNLQILQDSIVYKRNSSLISKYQQASINIPLPIAFDKALGKPFVCEGSIGSTPVKFFISYGYANRLKFTPNEIAKGVFNLLDHFEELIPSQEKIGLVTFQNGMQNSPEDFEKMGNKICENIPERTLCIGLYNPTEGLLRDLLRVNNKLDAELSDICCYTLAMIKTFAKKIWTPNRMGKPYWCHFAHSEGGIIARLSLILMEHDKSLESGLVKSTLATHFIPVTYGAVLPIPTSFTKNAMNTYSAKDEATLPRVKRYLNSIDSTARKNYTNVKIVKCEKLPGFEQLSCPKDRVTNEKFKQMSLWEQYAYVESIKAEAACTAVIAPVNVGINSVNAIPNYIKGDHDFQGLTYQKALSNNIDYLRKTFNGFYSG